MWNAVIVGLFLGLGLIGAAFVIEQGNDEEVSGSSEQAVAPTATVAPVAVPVYRAPVARPTWDRSLLDRAEERRAEREAAREAQAERLREAAEYHQLMDQLDDIETALEGGCRYDPACYR